ncbi:AAA family ATPase [Pseudoalteromonas sp. Angola-18]|uniref:AAA family ATPase n=1 Tax=Pseudoalteromonas sp. Angola-18 TaxID=3025338 RepID=UPI00235940C1|nr:AAA family ATPase [Pseudoalteromonas sp. Angola-18]MDC9501070.1 AAA family ATPase [Pseudoalteromonas sp. Angola-18]
MRLVKARVQKYRSVRDSGWFDVDLEKTIFVGPNEAGKTAILQALQHLSPPNGHKELTPLRDYPRSEYNDITSKIVDPSDVEVVSGKFALEEKDKIDLPEEYHDCFYVYSRRLDNKTFHHIENGPAKLTMSELRKDLMRMESHMLKQAGDSSGEIQEGLATLISDVKDTSFITVDLATKLKAWLEGNLDYVDETHQTEEKRYDDLLETLNSVIARDGILQLLRDRLPVFVLFSNYYRVRPQLHLQHLATRLTTGVLDDEQYDYGNKCLLELLGFTAQELSDLGKVTEPNANDKDALQKYKDQLDNRNYQLNAASVKLTKEIREVWAPDKNRDEANQLKVTADGQYLKVVVVDDLGVEIELDQRSEGFQWLVSFFVVFFAEAASEHENAILLLDEPGLSLHALKQREFRKTISRLSKNNQTLYTTHSPFLVGPNELDIVRVVEMTDRDVGTKVHKTIAANDPAGLLPLQEALGYDLAQSLFAQQKNLILEGLTDYWYVDAMSELLNAESGDGIKSNIALVPANSASKVVYFATLLHAQKLKVSALLDSDAAGEAAASQDTLVNALGNKAIIRTKDVYKGDVKKTEVEDLLRDTLVEIAKSSLGWDIESQASSQASRPIVDIFDKEISNFSKYKLAKAFLKWSRENDSSALKPIEVEQWKALFTKVNNALK